MTSLSQPVRVHNLTAWFIFAPPAAVHPTREYAVLEETIDAATAVLHETGNVRDAASPTSLQLTYDSESVTAAIEDYAVVLEPALSKAGGNVVGVVWAINGVPSHADQYVSPQLFKKLWRKLLRAAATDAIAQRPRRDLATAATTEPPSIETIREWLVSQASTQSSHAEEEQLPPRTRLRTHSGASHHRFEAFDSALDEAIPLHVAVVAQ